LGMVGLAYTGPTGPAKRFSAAIFLFRHTKVTVVKKNITRPM
jgi:hypothetical protein